MSPGPRVAILGTGFMGSVHAHAVRANGGTIAVVASSSPAKAEAGAERFGAQRAARTVAEAVESPDVDIVHVCTPNQVHAEHTMLALNAGKHVVCEKPLATDTTTTAQLAAAAEAAGAVTAVPFIYRFYPTVRDARRRIRSGEIGDLQVLHGSYLQDWLAVPSDDNWRVDETAGGPSRAFADIGVHWCDLVEFTTGHRIARVSARTKTAYPKRSGVKVTTEDIAVVQFETDKGALGSLVVSQISHGRKNRLWFSIDGEWAALAFDQELPDALWIGGRDENRSVFRGNIGTRYDRLPAGHPQGYQDCFDSLVADMFDAVAGDRPDGLPDFLDGHRAAVVTNAVLASSDAGTWIEIGEFADATH